MKYKRLTRTLKLSIFQNKTWMYNLYCILCVVCCVLCVVCCVLYVVRCMLYVVCCVLCVVCCMLYVLRCTLYVVRCTLYVVRCTLYVVRCTLYVLWYCIIYILHRQRFWIRHEGSLQACHIFVRQMFAEIFFFSCRQVQHWLLFLTLEIFFSDLLHCNLCYFLCN